MPAEKVQKRKPKPTSRCPVSGRCGCCAWIDVPYEEQLARKQARLEALLSPFCPVRPIRGMQDPFHYRNKVHAVFGGRPGKVLAGVYRAGTRELVPTERCELEDAVSARIAATVRELVESFKIIPYQEKNGTGLFRHVLIRRGFATGQILVVLVVASPVFPSRRNFVRALLERHPEITTVVQNINGADTGMVLGEREQVLFGKGYIEDRLLGCTFRISPKSFYQVNPVQTETLYRTALEAAALSEKDHILDAYCGIGTIGLIAAKETGCTVTGVELNRDAVRDAIRNAEQNGIRNAKFICVDAGAYCAEGVSPGTFDAAFLDPPRAGSTREFLGNLALAAPSRIVYISCNPETLARDLRCLTALGYRAEFAQGVDMFPMTEHIECVVLLTREKQYFP